MIAAFKHRSHVCCARCEGVCLGGAGRGRGPDDPADVPAVPPHAPQHDGPRHQRADLQILQRGPRLRDHEGGVGARLLRPPERQNETLAIDR